MVGGGPEAVEEGVEPGNDEGDLNQGLGFPRMEEIRKGMLVRRQKRDRPRCRREIRTFCCVCAGR